MTLKVAILIPMRYDNGWRDRLWAFCRQQWASNFPGWPVFEGMHLAEEGPFNRSLAINRASDLADRHFGAPWDVALIIDGDTLSDPGAVQRAVDHAAATGHLAVAHSARHMLTRRATDMILQGADPATVMRSRSSAKKVYYDSISCAVAVRRDSWDMVGGFDDKFVGWGFEDTAFRIAVETMTEHHLHIERSDCLHLWHESSPEASQYAPTYARNHARKRRYEAAHFQRERMEALLAGMPDPGAQYGRIPKILHRTVPERTSEQVEEWWAQFELTHPTWELRTWREPLDPADFPLTGHLFDRCANGAQKAGLVRLELLVTHGGVYVDSDVEPVRPLDPLTYSPAFAGWEDDRVVPDAVLGSAPGHPAMRECLARAVALVEGGSVDAWETGPGVTTAVLPGRDDVLLLPPGSFYPVHYLEKALLGSRNQSPWVFLEHKWHHSWASPKQRATNERRQRVRVTPSQAPGVEPARMPDGAEVRVCIPWRDSRNTLRSAAYAWCREWWEHHGLPVVVSPSGASRAAMCNSAAEAAIAEGANVLVFMDADTFVEPANLYAAVVLAMETGQLVHAFDDYVKLDGQVTRAAMRSGIHKFNAHRLSRQGRHSESHVSGASVITVDAWRRVGGFDERFVKWGFEDQAFHLACETILGSVNRVAGQAYHWYHLPDPTKHEAVADETLVLMTAYCQAAGRVPTHGRTGRLASQGLIAITASEPNAEIMQTVLSSTGGPLSRADAVS